MKKASYKVGGMANKNKSATTSTKATGLKSPNSPVKVSPSAKKGGASKSKKK